MRRQRTGTGVAVLYGALEGKGYGVPVLHLRSLIWFLYIPLPIPMYAHT